MPYRKVKIISCSDPDFWYAHKIGDTVLVRDVDWPSSYVEHKSGASVLRSDLVNIGRSHAPCK